MHEVAIIGAGELGGACAHILARQNFVASIRLVDDRGSIAIGKALDITQAGPIEAFATRLTGTNDVASAAGASVVIVADRAGGTEWEGEDALRLVTRLTQMSASTVIVCAGAAQRELVDRATREIRINRTRVFGSAPEALVAAARALIALAVDGSPRDVAVSVVGVPPAHAVVTWQGATIAGFAAAGLLDEPTRRRLDAHIHAMWPPAPYALAAAAVAAIDVIAGRSRRILSCFVGPDVSSGVRAQTAALPVRLGPAGIAQVITPSLSAAEQIALQTAMML